MGPASTTHERGLPASNRGQHREAVGARRRRGLTERQQGQPVDDRLFELGQRVDRYVVARGQPVADAGAVGRRGAQHRRLITAQVDEQALDPGRGGTQGEGCSDDGGTDTALQGPAGGEHDDSRSGELDGGSRRDRP